MNKQLNKISVLFFFSPICTIEIFCKITTNVHTELTELFSVILHKYLSNLSPTGKAVKTYETAQSYKSSHFPVFESFMSSVLTNR